MKRKKQDQLNSKLSSDDIDEALAILNRVYKRDGVKCLEKHIESIDDISALALAVLNEPIPEGMEENQFLVHASIVVGLLLGIRYASKMKEDV